MYVSHLGPVGDAGAARVHEAGQRNVVLEPAPQPLRAQPAPGTEEKERCVNTKSYNIIYNTMIWYTIV